MSTVSLRGALFATKQSLIFLRKQLSVFNRSRDCHVAALLAMTLFVQGVHAAPGKTGFEFLKLGSGARNAGLGETGTAMAEGASAIYWNPAGLGMTRQNEVTLTHLQYFEDATQQYAGYAMPLQKGEKGGLGFSFTRFGVKNIESRDAQSTLLGTVEEEDLALQASYGFRVGGKSSSFDRDGLYLGAGIKSLSQKLAGVSASGLAYDLGLQYRPGSTMSARFGEWTRRTSVALVGTNLGSGPKFDKEKTPLPQTAKLGLAYTHFLWGDALNFVVDAAFPQDGSTTFSEGVEFWIKNTFALRLGSVGGQDIGNSLRAGAGFRFQTLELNYAWADFGEAFGNTHRFTLNFRFGEGAVSEKTGLQKDLVRFHLSQAQDALTAGSYNEAILEANHVLEVDPRNPQALQILIESGEKLKPADALPEPKPVNPESNTPNEDNKPK